MQEGTEARRAAFNQAYALLNAAQKQAVDTIEGPVMVIAGPGTGKTQILTLRIAKILLETQMGPENVLALTFTEAGAKAMRDRLHSYIGSDAYAVGIYTFHGFASRLISQYPDAFVRIVGGRVATDLDKTDLIETILADTSIKLLRPIGNPTYYVSPLLRILSALKGENITPDGLATLIVTQETALQGTEQFHTKGVHKGKVRGEYQKLEKSIAKNKELLYIYRQYEALLQDRQLYDFDDMILETVHALESNEDMLRDLQEQYQYILADEHQDVNGAQNRILELLSNYHDAPNLFAVGDEKQAIYRFQGASLENFLKFTDIFPNTQTIELIENYRSGQLILDTAHSLIAVEDGPLAKLRVPLHAATTTTATVDLQAFPHQGIEDEWVVAAIKAAIDDGTAPEEIAVIVRTNREVEAIAAALRAAGLSVHASADADILEHPLTHMIESIISAITKPHDETALFTVLHGAYWDISAGDLVRIARGRQYDRALADIIADRAILEELNVTDPVAVQRVHTLLTNARKQALLQAPHFILATFLVESGFLDAAIAADPAEGGRVIRRIYDEIEQMVVRDNKASLAAVQETFARHRQHRLPLNAPYIQGPEHAVQVLTAHKSKGLEFDVVCIPHLVDSAWGGSKMPTYFDIPFARYVRDEDIAMDDERRLFYVAMTRAKRVLHLSYAQANGDGKVLSASRLLDELDSALLTTADTTAITAAFDPTAALRTKSVGIVIDPALLTAYLTARGLSATSLNNYLSSPWNFLYRNVLRIPEVQSLPLLYGTALHGVMEWVSAGFARSGDLPTTTALSAQLTAELTKLPIGHVEFTQLHEKGLFALTTYLAETANQFVSTSKVEFTVTARLTTGLSDLPEVILTGKLDRLDLNPDGSVGRVVDYKTGKPKTRNDIEGKTQSSDGNYKRQLVFYALLLSLYEAGKYACRSCTLSFLEPDDKGRIHEETFEITDAEIEALKHEIIAVVQAITSGSFLKLPCDPGTSDYCHLVALLQREIK